MPGVSGNPGGQRKITAEARGIFEDFTPTVAREITKIFTELCEDEDKDYELILTYAKEILDRGLGKPKQAVDISESTDEDEEYERLLQFLEGGAENIRLAAELSHRVALQSRINGGVPEQGQMEDVPLPPGAEHNTGSSSAGPDKPQDNNLNAS